MNSLLIGSTIINITQIGETLIIVSIIILLWILTNLNIAAVNTFERHLGLADCQSTGIRPRTWHALLLTVLLRVLICLHKHLVVVTILVLLTRFLRCIWVLTFFTLWGRANAFAALESVFTWLIILKCILT